MGYQVRFSFDYIVNSGLKFQGVDHAAVAKGPAVRVADISMGMEIGTIDEIEKTLGVDPAQSPADA